MICSAALSSSPCHTSVISTFFQSQHVWKTLPSVEWLPGKCQNCVWKLERRKQLYWCDPGVWGWSAGGGTQSDLGCFQSLFQNLLRGNKKVEVWRFLGRCEGKHPTEISTILENIEHWPFLETILWTLRNLTTRWIQWWRKVKTEVPMDISFLIFAKYVEKRAMAETLEITLKQTISKELSSPATSVIKLSGLKIVLGPTNHASIQTNLHTCPQIWFKINFFSLQNCHPRIWDVTKNIFVIRILS